jgi:phage/plasmid-associated DNA primase
MEIAATPRFAGHRHFIFVTGKRSGLFVLDYDIKNSLRADHADKIDGIKFGEQECGPLDAPDTLTMRSIGGGYHKVYKLTPELEGMLQSKQLTPVALVDILYEGCGFMFGDGCSIVHRMLPQTPPANVVQFIQNNITTNNNVQINVTMPASELSDRLSKAYGIVTTWIVKRLDDAYQLTPDTNRCCVHIDHTHSQTGHSCLYVRKNAVTANCFSHGKRMIEGEMSRNIREMFFTYSAGGKKPTAILIDAVIMAAKQANLVRENGAVMRPVPRREGAAYAYEYMSTYEEFVSLQLMPHDELVREQPRRFNDVMVYMRTMNHVDFPIVHRDYRYVSFTNGILDIVDGHMVGPETLERSAIPRHHINLPCSFDNLNTPLFDQLVYHQLEDDVIYTYLLALIGRLLYPVREFDTFDIVPFVVGEVNTGKSTLVNIICALFAPERVGVFDSTHEMIFGLQSKHDKELIVASEITDKMVQQLSSDIFRKMVCGERVNIPIKHAAAIASVPWRVPLFFCGNEYLSYADERGSISKRLAIFRFAKYVHVRKDTLEQQIITQELAALLVKSLVAYRQLIAYAGDRGFWDTCPDYFRDTRDEMNENTDHLTMFLTLGPDGNAWSNKSLYFMHMPGREMLLEEFKKKFANYMRFRHPNVKYKWRQDYSAFKRLGYDVVYAYTCKSCLTDHGPGCCAHYSHANRSKRYVIKDIVCVETERGAIDY